MNRFNGYQRILALLLSAIIFFEFSGCYSVRGIAKSEIQQTDRNYFFIHSSQSYFRLDNVTIAKGVLTGKISDIVKPPPKSQSVHLYISPDSAIIVSGNDISVDYNNIAKAEIYKPDGGKTILFGAAVAASAFLVFALVMLIVKGASCPFIYSEDGTNNNFEGEIYSGATALPLERDDYLKLKSIKPVDNLYKIKLTNEVKEIQNTNFTELLVFDHSPGTDILMDKYGKAYSVQDIQKPLTVYDNYGRSLINEVASIDSIRYISEIKNDHLLKDSIAVSFEKPQDVKNARLIVSGKNTMWLDYNFGRFADLFGNKYDKWKENRDKKSREELLQWTMDQGMPLSVYLETDEGWKFVDYFNMPGPMADKEDVLNIDLSGVSGNKINLKLVAGMLFWDIDLIGMDFSFDQNIKTTTVPVSSAFDENSKNTTDLLIKDDDKYLIQPDGNDVTSITFRPPESIPDTERTVFLHSAGNYEILRDTKGKPDIAYLKSFLEPGAFIKFSKDHFLQYYQPDN